MRDVVNRTILEIEFIKSDTSREYNQICAEFSNFLSASYAWKESVINESLLNVQNKNVQGSIRDNLNNTISFIVYDTNKSQVVGSSGDNAAEIFARKVSLNANNKELYPAVASVVSNSIEK